MDGSDKTKKIIKVCIIGVGARGGEFYGRYMNENRDKYKIVCLCDKNPERLEKYGQVFDVPENNRYLDEDEFFKERRGDLLIVSTLDKLHIRMASKGLKLGYNLLLEKPISKNVNELNDLVKLTKETGKTVMVCHVLRYTAAIRKIKEILDSGAIGKLISVDHTENVVFWHEAHSYVRGNWRNGEETSPMIMAKCCHDFDLLQYFIGAKCKSVSSMGSLAYLKKEYKPEGSADRCMECKYIDTCPYSAKKIYVDMWKNDTKCSENIWPMNAVTDTYPLTEESLTKAIENGPFGRCVFACDNDVVDNQTTIMQFENGVTATLKMEAFVKYGGRRIRFFGSDGELYFKEDENVIQLRPFFGKDEEWKLTDLTDDLEGHGGGDHRMIDKLYEVLTDSNTLVDTSIENSVESHLMAIAAENSRVNGGELQYISELRK